jgi:hypothetical protein
MKQKSEKRDVRDVEFLPNGQFSNRADTLDEEGYGDGMGIEGMDWPMPKGGKKSHENFRNKFAKNQIRDYDDESGYWWIVHGVWDTFLAFHFRRWWTEIVLLEDLDKGEGVVVVTGVLEGGYDHWDGTKCHRNPDEGILYIKIKKCKDFRRPVLLPLAGCVILAGCSKQLDRFMYN